jgi:hypothetical protein
MIFLGMIVRASVQFVFVASFKVLCSRGSAYALYGVGSCGNSTRDIKVVIVQRVQAVVFFLIPQVGALAGILRIN